MEVTVKRDGLFVSASRSINPPAAVEKKRQLGWTRFVRETKMDPTTGEQRMNEAQRSASQNSDAIPVSPAKQQADAPVQPAPVQTPAAPVQPAAAQPPPVPPPIAQPAPPQAPPVQTTARVEEIIKQLPQFRDAATAMQEIILANLVMIGEVPAPTGEEGSRVEMILQRLSECGLQNCSSDEQGNGYGVLLGEQGTQNILISAHADTFVSDVVDQTIEVGKERVVGPFVGDNCLALAAMVSLPTLFDRLQIRLKSNLLLIATAKALGRGNLEGLKYFLANSAMPVHAGICLEGVQLGRLNYSCLGMFRGDIVCRLPDDYNWAQYGASGAIIPMNDVISRINKIPLPRRPLTSIVMGSIEGGITYHNIARQVTLRFEVRCEESELLKQIRQQIDNIVAEVSAQSGVRMKLDIFAEREPGGIDISHPMVQSARAIISALALEPMLYPTTSALAAFIDRKIPAITVGVATGERKGELDEIDESVLIAPIFTGMAQLAGVILAMDQGGAP